MNPGDLLSIYDRQIRFESTDAVSERQAVPADAPLVVRHVPLDAHTRWGWITWSRLDEANADRMIADQVAFFAESGHNFEWKRYGHDGPPDLDERLLKYGFNREEHESVMVLDLEAEQGAGWPSDPKHPERSRAAVWPAESKDAGAIEIRRITDPADLDKVVQIEDAVWNESHAWIAEELRYELTLPGELLLMYLAYAEAVPAAAAWIRFHPGTDFAALFGGSTLPQYRQRGLYSALLDVRARAARKRGYRFLSVDASEMSRPILEKHGFVKITTATAYKYRLPGLAD